MELTLNDWLFIGEYVKDWKPLDALRRAGFYHGKFGRQEAYRRCQKPGVKAEVEKIRKDMKNRVLLNIDMVIDDITNVLAADPRELYEIITASCRHCHGENFRYQRTQREYEIDQFKADAERKPFNPLGGTGYNPYADPNPDCPECHGRGETLERIRDVRELSPAAASLYMGGERTKNGLKINMRSKDAAREAAAKFLGMNKETLRVLDGKDVKDLSDDELLKLAQGEGK